MCQKKDGLLNFRLSPTALIALLVTLCQLVAVPALLAQEITVRVSPERGTLSDVYQFSVTLSGAADSGLQPKISPSTDFSATFVGPSQSIRIEQGRIEANTTFRYQLFPKRVGSLKTPIIELRVGDQILVAAPLDVLVQDAPPVPSAEQAIGNRVFLTQRLDQNEVYVGEQVVVAIELHTAARIRDPQFGDLTYEGFWNQMLAEQEQYTRMIRGERFSVIRFRRALYPLSAGTKELAPRELTTQMLVQRPRSQRGVDPFDPFAMDDDFFQQFLGIGEFRELSIKSNASSLRVLPLPPFKSTNSTIWNEHAPVVGDTNLTLRHSGQVKEGAVQLKVGDSLTLNYLLTSFGNISSITDLKLPEGPDYNLYAERPEQSQEELNGRLLSRALFRYSIVPRQAGTILLPSLSVTYFDPLAKRYREAQVDGLKLEVVAEVGSGSSPASTKIEPAITATALPSAQVTAHSEGAPTVKEEIALPAPSWSSVKWWDSSSLLVFILVLLLSAGALLAGVYFEIFSNRVRRRWRRAIRAAKSPAELRKLLLALLEERGLTNLSALTPLEIRERLRQLERDRSGRVREQLSFAVYGLFELLDEGLFYVGESGPAVDLEDLKQRINAVLEELLRIKFG